MNRNPLRRRPAPGTTSRYRCLLVAATAFLLLAGLLSLAGCGQDDQRVGEHVASGERPAPLPNVDPNVPPAEVPPTPPAEPSLPAASPNPPATTAVPASAAGSAAIASPPPAAAPGATAAQATPGAPKAPAAKTPAPPPSR
jgi:hypothetical protein